MAHDFFGRFKSLRIVSLIISGSSGRFRSSSVSRFSFSSSRQSFYFSFVRLCSALARFRILRLSSLSPFIQRDYCLSYSTFCRLIFTYWVKSRVRLVLFLDSIAFVFSLRLVSFLSFKLGIFVIYPSKVCSGLLLLLIYPSNVPSFSAYYDNNLPSTISSADRFKWLSARTSILYPSYQRFYSMPRIPLSQYAFKQFVKVLSSSSSSFPIGVSE